jgi:hypothetical protein
MAGYSIDKDRIVWKNIGDETIVADIESGAYYTLEGPAREIWEAVAAGGGLKEAVDRVVAEYAVERGEAEKDAKDFIRELEANRLIA